MIKFIRKINEYYDNVSETFRFLIALGLIMPGVLMLSEGDKSMTLTLIGAFWILSILVLRMIGITKNKI